MCGGGTTSTSTVSIPPEVLANYQEVYGLGKQLAQKPFVPYSQDPNAFVAGLNTTQQAALNNINRLVGYAEPDVRQGQNLIMQGIQQGTPLQYQSLATVGRGQERGEAISDRALSEILAARQEGSQYASDAAKNIYAGMAAANPYMQESAGLTRAGLGAGAGYGNLASQYLGRGTQAIGPGELNVDPYMSPYMRNVVAAQQALQAEENASQRAALTGEAIRAGAFGGDRAGIAQANLARQQSLANQATLSNLLQSGYGQALSTAQQQQAQELAAAQANRQAQQFGSQQAASLGQQQFAQNLAAAQQQMGLGQALYGQNIGQGQAIAGLGQQQFGQGLGAAQAGAGIGQNIFQMAAQNAGMQQAAGNNLFNYGLQGGQAYANLGLANQAAQQSAIQAQMQMGQIQQQTDQAAKTAMYNQFMQQQGYPFQQVQFLGNLAMGTGALSGSTTTTNSSGGGFFSDRRLKKNIEKIGETYDGQNIYRYNYKGEPRTQIGLLADETDKKAVGEANGYKTVDYKKATDKAAERGHFYAGGLVPSSMGGAVDQMSAYENFARGGYADGGWTYQPRDEEGSGRDSWINEKTGEVRYKDPTTVEAQQAEEQKAASEAAIAKLDPRIAGFYDQYMFRQPDAAGAEFWQKQLDSGMSIDQIEKGIAESRERQRVNQVPLTYNASAFRDYGAPVFNQSGWYAASPMDTRSAFQPAPMNYGFGGYNPYGMQNMQSPQATGKGPSLSGGANQGAGTQGGSTSAGRFGSYAVEPAAQTPAATGKGPSTSYQQPSYGMGYGMGYSQPSYGMGYGMGYQQPSYGMGYQQPSYGMGGMGYGQPSFNMGYNAYSQPDFGYGGGRGMTGFMSGYNQGYGSPMGGYGAMGGMPQASGKGPSSSGRSSGSGSSSGGGGFFKKGGRVGYALGGGSHLDPNDLAAIQAQRIAELAPFAAGIPGQTLPGSQGTIPNKLLHVPKLITADTRGIPQQKSPFEHAMLMANLGEKANAAFDDKGWLGKEGFIRRNVSNLTNKAGGAGGGADNVGAGAPAPAPNAGGVKPPSQKEAALDGEILPPELDPDLYGTMLSARGGAIHRALGGALPYSQLGGGGYIPDEVLEDPQIRGLPKNDAELRAAAKAATSQSGGLGQAVQGISAINTLGKMGSKGIEGLKTLFAPGGEAAAATGLGTAASEAAAAGLGAGAAEAAGALGAGAGALGEAAAAALPVAEAAGKGVSSILPFLLLERGGRANHPFDRHRSGHYRGGVVPHRRRYATEGGVPDEEYAIRTIAAEMSGKSPEEARGIAAVIENRLKSGRWGENYRDVVTARNQFEPWNKPEGPNYPMRFAADSPRMQMAREAFAARGEDPTGGALNFYAPAAQAILAQTKGDRAAVPSWARNREYTDLGATRFVRDADAGAPRLARAEAPRPPGLVPASNQIAAASTSDASNDPVSQAAVAAARSEARAAAGTEVVKPEGGLKPQQTFVAPKDPRGKEQTWSDFLTSRQFIIPALTALGTMGTTPTRNFGTALSAGVLAGAKSFQDLEEKLSEVEKKREEVGTQAQQTGKVGMETRVLESGLYERQWVRGRGWYILDKSNPTKPPVQITDKDLNPLPGFEGKVEKVPVKPGSELPTGGSATEPKTTSAGRQEAPKPTEPPKAAPAAAPATEPAKKLNVNDWTPTVSLPENYEPPEHLNIEMDPKLKEQQGAIAKPVIDEQNRKAESAYDQLYALDEMDKQFNNLPSSGILTPGAYANERKDFAIRANTFVQALGGKPAFNPDDVAAMESLSKNTFRLGAALARGIGSREPGFIVQQSVQANPGIENTKIGYARISAGLREAAKYEQDKAQFYNNYYSRFGHLSGAEEMFRKLNPPQMYADRAILSTVDPRDKDALVNAIKDNPEILSSAREKIDAKYGKGITDKILGR